MPSTIQQERTPGVAVIGVHHGVGGGPDLWLTACCGAGWMLTGFDVSWRRGVVVVLFRIEGFEALVASWSDVVPESDFDGMLAGSDEERCLERVDRGVGSLGSGAGDVL